MATALITGGVAGQYGAQVMKPGSTQQVVFTTSAQSNAFDTGTRMVRIIADAIVFVAFGSNPTADATSIKIPANTVEYFEVDPGAKVACYDGSS